MDFTTVLTIFAIIVQIVITRIWQAFILIPLAAFLIMANNFVNLPLHQNFFFWPLAFCWAAVWIVWLERRPPRLTQRQVVHEQALTRVAKVETSQAMRRPAPQAKSSQKRKERNPKIKTIASKYSRDELQQIEFSYQDFDGNVTFRRVVTNNTDGLYIKGFCLLRDENRTFRLDNILGNVIVISTGEMLDPYSWCDEFRRAR